MNKHVHFSIDDVGKSLRYLTRSRPTSMFDLRFFGTLKHWHETFGINVTLYCYAMLEDFLISEIPDCYGDELKKSNTWLSFGFHSKCSLPFVKETGYAAGFELCQQAFERLGVGKTNTLRLHSWLATKEQKDFLYANGIKTLLYPDNDNHPYQSDDTFSEAGLAHQRTHVWIEKLDAITNELLCIGKEKVIVFTHEWCFDENLDKIGRLFSIYKDNGYIFNEG